jgi:hypothetical protein
MKKSASNNYTANIIVILGVLVLILSSASSVMPV